MQTSCMGLIDRIKSLRDALESAPPWPQSTNRYGWSSLVFDQDCETGELALGRSSAPSPADCTTMETSRTNLQHPVDTGSRSSSSVRLPELLSPTLPTCYVAHNKLDRGSPREVAVASALVLLDQLDQDVDVLSEERAEELTQRCAKVGRSLKHLAQASCPQDKAMAMFAALCFLQQYRCDAMIRRLSGRLPHAGLLTSLSPYIAWTRQLPSDHEHHNALGTLIAATTAFELSEVYMTSAQAAIGRVQSVCRRSTEESMATLSAEISTDVSSVQTLLERSRRQALAARELWSTVSISLQPDDLASAYPDAMHDLWRLNFLTNLDTSPQRTSNARLQLDLYSSPAKVATFVKTLLRYEQPSATNL